MTSMSCMRIYCMCGAAWSSRWLIMQLTNGQHACVLVFMSEADILNTLCDQQLFTFSSHDELCFTPCDMWYSKVLRVHYKSLKCDVSFSQGGVSSIFRWGGHFSYMWKKFLPAYNSAKLITINQDFPKLRSQMYCHLMVQNVCIHTHSYIHI